MSKTKHWFCQTAASPKTIDNKGLVSLKSGGQPVFLFKEILFNTIICLTISTDCEARRSALWNSKYANAEVLTRFVVDNQYIGIVL